MQNWLLVEDVNKNQVNECGKLDFANRVAEQENRGLLKLLGACKNQGERFVGEEITGTVKSKGKADFEAAIGQAFDKQKLFYVNEDGFFYKYQQFWWSMGFTLVKYCS